MQVVIDGSQPFIVARELRNDYVLEQCKLRKWRIVSTWSEMGRIFKIEALDNDGREHLIEVKD